MPPADAATISVADTLAMLDGPKREIAEGVANDQFVLWLGSGISRAKMPDLRGAAKKVMIDLHARRDLADPNCRYLRALQSIVDLAAPGPEERGRTDYSVKPEDWPDFGTFAGRLVSNYARMLDVTIDNEQDDYILWDILGLPGVYSDPTIEPDVEHLCLAALAIEGVASDMPSPNWDPLIERATRDLAGDQPILRVVVAPEELRRARERGNLYKFHGCAEAANGDPGKYRQLLVGRHSQIDSWIASNEVMRNFLIQLIVTKRALMLGLSAQDSNIQGLFAEAKKQMAWRWPDHPPAFAFSENALGGGHAALLKNVYKLDYDPANRNQIEEEALIKAYAKPLLLSLFLYVLTAKFKALVDRVLPAIAADDRKKLHEGLVQARDCVAAVMKCEVAAVVELLKQIGRAMSLFRRGETPEPARGFYRPITLGSVHQLAADPDLDATGINQLAVALGLIGLGLKTSSWTASKSDLSDNTSGAFTLTGKRGSARFYFAASTQAAIRLVANGLIADNDDGIDAVVVHSHQIIPESPRYPRRPPGRTGLAALRDVSMDELLADGTSWNDLLTRFKTEVAL